MGATASILRTHGELTVPLDVLQELGLKTGDKIEFVVEEGRAFIQPAQPDNLEPTQAGKPQSAQPDDDNPFTKWIGILGPLPDGMTSLDWCHMIRYGDEPQD